MTLSFPSPAPILQTLIPVLTTSTCSLSLSLSLERKSREAEQRIEQTSTRKTPFKSSVHLTLFLSLSKFSFYISLYIYLHTPKHKHFRPLHFFPSHFPYFFSFRRRKNEAQAPHQLRFPNRHIARLAAAGSGDASHQCEPRLRAHAAVAGWGARGVSRWLVASGFELRWWTCRGSVFGFELAVDLLRGDRWEAVEILRRECWC